MRLFEDTAARISHGLVSNPNKPTGSPRQACVELSPSVIRAQLAHRNVCSFFLMKSYVTFSPIVQILSIFHSPAQNHQQDFANQPILTHKDVASQRWGQLTGPDTLQTAQSISSLDHGR